jgi:glycosyltransferase involved in cell wall biosynthesis
MKVLHFIANLGQGGAEAVLTRLIMASPPTIEHVVVSLMGDAYYGPRLRAAGIRVHTIESPRGRVTLGGLMRLRRIVVAASPDVVQTWMYHADLVGGLVARSASVRAVVWGIRHSNLAADKTSFSARAVARLCAVLSRWVPAAIACCSVHATAVHQAIGYQANKFTVIPNGYDLARFTPDDAARARLRAEWGVVGNEIMLGMVARWDPQKDHENLLKALANLMAAGVNFRCILVGTGMHESNTALAGLLHSLVLQDRVILAGPRDDIPAVMNALDLHVLSSAGEAFPNALAEAMACGTPCVTTDVGDAALIVGETGWVVPPQNSERLAQGIFEGLAVLSSRGRAVIGNECRQRIKENFSVDRMVDAYVTLWQRVIKAVK